MPLNSTCSVPLLPGDSSQSHSLFPVNAKRVGVMGSVKIKASNPPKDPFLFEWAHTGPLCDCCLCGYVLS